MCTSTVEVSSFRLVPPVNFVFSDVGHVCLVEQLNREHRFDVRSVEGMNIVARGKAADGRVFFHDEGGLFVHLRLAT
jgi:hypothetical protein